MKLSCSALDSELSVPSFKGIIHCYVLGLVPRTMLLEIVTTLSVVYLQCAVMLRKYIVVKYQKAFAKSPSMMPNTVDAWGSLVPYSPLTNMCLTLVRVCLCWLRSFKCFFVTQKCMKFMKILFCVCVNKNTYYISTFHLLPGHPLLFSAACFCVQMGMG